MMNFVASIDMFVDLSATRDDVDCRSEERFYGGYADSDD